MFQKIHQIPDALSQRLQELLADLPVLTLVRLKDMYQSEPFDFTDQTISMARIIDLAYMDKVYEGYWSAPLHSLLVELCIEAAAQTFTKEELIEFWLEPYGIRNYEEEMPSIKNEGTENVFIPEEKKDLEYSEVGFVDNWEI